MELEIFFLVIKKTIGGARGAERAAIDAKADIVNIAALVLGMTAKTTRLDRDVGESRTRAIDREGIRSEAVRECLRAAIVELITRGDGDLVDTIGDRREIKFKLLLGCKLLVERDPFPLGAFGSHTHCI